MKINLFLTALVISTFFSACQSKKGCTDSVALNHDIDADKDDGSCEYSALTFYQSWSSYIIGADTVPVTKVEIYVNGEKIGNCTSAYGSDFPHNCHGDGTIFYQLEDGEKIYWNSRTYFPNGHYDFWEGEAQSDPNKDCIKIHAQQ